MKLLIGNTGTVGKTLKDFIKFDYEFNSSNINQLPFVKHTDHNSEIHLSCLPANKWQINQNPVKDLNNMVNIVNLLQKNYYDTVVLYSTIDVYQENLYGTTEKDVPTFTGVHYGSIRYMFEELVKNHIKYNKLLIVRLPGLFGKHIKKNIIYDLIHNNRIDKITLDSQFQWYNLDYLVSDIVKGLEGDYTLKVQNLFTEPIHTSQIFKQLNIESKFSDNKTKGIYYDCKTLHTPTGYISTQEKVLLDLLQFVQSSKS